MMDSTQLNRRANLRRLLAILEHEGVSTIEGQAQVFGVKQALLKNLLAGDDIADILARELEWSAQRPLGWLDDDHRGQHLDD